MANKNIRVIFDTNVWISFLIGKKLLRLKEHILDLIEYSKADYLVTGDRDLLERNPFKTAQILKPAEFENHLNKRSPNR